MKVLVVMLTMIGFSQMTLAEVVNRKPLARTSKTYQSEKDSEIVYRTDITVYDDSSIEVDLDRYYTFQPMFTGNALDYSPPRSKVIRRNVSTMNSVLLRSEMNEVVDLIVDLSGAPVKQVVSTKICAMVPPKYLVNAPLAVVGDFDFRTIRFYKPLTEVFSDSGCYEMDKTFLENASDQKIAYRLIKKITDVADIMMKKYTQEK